MSGTSLDGVDYALCRIDQHNIKLVNLWSVPYPRRLRDRLLAAASNWLSSYELSQLNHDLGRFYSEHAPKARCDYIGLHGQTVFHNPKKPFVATAQIGEAAYLAAKFKKPVISQFRAMDLAMGGQGAPLATFFHHKVFGKIKDFVAVNNLGGISNVTYLSKSKILSFDTGPGNILMDYAVTHFTKGKWHCDRDGALAAQGIPNGTLVKKWLGHTFFSKRPPKSTGREEFGSQFFEKTLKDCRKLKMSKKDTLATFCAFTAESIAESYAKFLPVFPQYVVLCGGGASNPTLTKMIQMSLRKKEWEIKGQRLTEPVEVVTSQELGWPHHSIEAAAFALLAYQTMTNKPGNLHKTTGARRDVILGQITPAPY